MPLPKQTVSWPLSGGLDTKRSPLTIQPGSFLQVDNAIQERAGEWRRRNGFTQAAVDNINTAMIGNLGASGMLSRRFDGGSADVYAPSLASNKWLIIGLGGTADFPSTFERTPVVASETTTNGFASVGDTWIVASAGTNPFVYLYDAAGKSSRGRTSIAGTALRVRCAATATHLVAFVADASGNLIVYSWNATTFASVSIATTIKTGLHTAQPYLDAIWYGGSTITVVARTSGDAVRYIEYNPATGALATDTTLAAVSCASCLSLLHEPSGSGIRLVATSHTTPTTRVVRVNSAGAIQTNDQVEAVVSTQIAGAAHAAGADWGVVYRTAALLRVNDKTAGVVGAPGTFRLGNTDELTIDSMAWADDAQQAYQVVIGLHSQSAADPQDSWVVMSVYWGAGGASGVQMHSSIVPQQGADVLQVNASLYQVARTSARTFMISLPVLSSYRNEAGTVTRKYSLDVFKQTWLANADIATVNIGKPVRYKETVYMPTNGISFFDDGTTRTLGVSAPPRAPTLTQAAGGALTPLTTNSYCVVVEKRDIDGNLWRSPPSVPADITLTVGNQTVGVAIRNWYTDEISGLYTVAVYRTSGNGSVFRRIKSFTDYFLNDFSFNDTAADSAIIDGEILYTTGELSTVITPPASHLALFGDRLWAVNRDFRTELWPSKNLRPGRQPEFAAEAVVDIDDDFGDITGISNLDDKGVVFKRNAIYFVTGDGLTDAGTGEAHRYTQVSQDIGAIPGSPVVAAGDVVYFVSDRGIYSVDRAGDVAFVGAPVDQYLSQPLVQTQETIFDAVFNPAKNWVIFVTTNYLLIHDRTLNYWTRFTGLSGMKRALIVNNRLVLFKNDGTVWREGDHTQTTDQGVAYTGVIRCPWMNAAGEERGLRLYRARVDGARTAGGASIIIPTSIYFDNDESKVENYTSTAIAGGTLAFRGEMKPGQTQNQKCTSFSIAVTLPSSDVTLRIQRLTATVGVRGGKSELLPASGGVVFS